MGGPGGQHWELLKQNLRDAGTAGNLTTDAHLAALAMERGMTLQSTDVDFTRFPGLKWKNPIG
jgi:predicted nucleic acid-binding protein